MRTSRDITMDIDAYNHALENQRHNAELELQAALAADAALKASIGASGAQAKAQAIADSRKHAADFEAWTAVNGPHR